ncbi:hypothetical protein CBL_05728 [Carabus blaptoides fortunei]
MKVLIAVAGILVCVSALPQHYEHGLAPAAFIHAAPVHKVVAEQVAYPKYQFNYGQNQS